MFIIKDWAGNHLFINPSWESFEEAEEFLSDKLGDGYDTDRQEYYIEEK